MYATSRFPVNIAISARNGPFPGRRWCQRPGTGPFLALVYWQCLLGTDLHETTGAHLNTVKGFVGNGTCDQ